MEPSSSSGAICTHQANLLHLNYFDVFLSLDIYQSLGASLPRLNDNDRIIAALKDIELTDLSKYSPEIADFDSLLSELLNAYNCSSLTYEEALQSIHQLARNSIIRIAEAVSDQNYFMSNQTEIRTAITSTIQNHSTDNSGILPFANYRIEDNVLRVHVGFFFRATFKNYQPESSMLMVAETDIFLNAIPQNLSFETELSLTDLESSRCEIWQDTLQDINFRKKIFPNSTLRFDIHNLTWDIFKSLKSTLLNDNQTPTYNEFCRFLQTNSPEFFFDGVCYLKNSRAIHRIFANIHQT
jgi:hypothetical protein